MSNQYDYTEEREGFTITLECLPEHDAPGWDFESEEEKQELFRKIDNGVLLWFCAKVSAHKHGILLASDYLGGCCYDDINQFLNDVYYQDMVGMVINEAKQAIVELNK